MPHLQTSDREAPWGSFDVPQGLEQGAGGGVLPWVLVSSGVTRDGAFCSDTRSADGVADDRVGAADRAFCFIERCRMMLHWRAMTS